MAIVIMILHLRPESLRKVEGCQLVEVFSGMARTSKVASAMGYRAKAVDHVYSKSMNLLEPSGFMFLGFSSSLLAH